MEEILNVHICSHNSCCYLPPRSTVAIISVLSLVACTLDLLTIEQTSDVTECCYARAHVDSLRLLLTALFQLANLILLLASIVESPFPVQLYVWYTLAFVVMGLAVSLADFLLRVRREGAAWGCSVFVPEVAFLFVIFRCLPLVDTYRKHLEGLTIITS